MISLIRIRPVLTRVINDRSHITVQVELFIAEFALELFKSLIAFGTSEQPRNHADDLSLQFQSQALRVLEDGAEIGTVLECSEDVEDGELELVLIPLLEVEVDAAASAYACGSAKEELLQEGNIGLEVLGQYEKLLVEQVLCKSFCFGGESYHGLERGHCVES
jgi:hypothetical protein